MIAFILLSYPIKIDAQAIAGAEIFKKTYNSVSKKLKIRIEVTRASVSKDFVLFDWGHGQIDTIPLASSYNDGPFFVIDHYNGEHYYDLEDSTKYYVLSFIEDQIISDFSNVNYSYDNTFRLTDSILIFNEGESPDVFTSLNIGPDPNSIDVDTFSCSGIVEYGLDYNIALGEDILEMELSQFPVNGYLPPAPPEELYVVPGLLVWDRPLVQGKYALATKSRELRGVNNPIYMDVIGSTMMVSTITKAFTLVVDSCNIVSVIGINENINTFSIYPNPAHDIIQLDYGGVVGSIQLQINNIQGQQVYEKTLEGFTNLQNQKIDISDWPAGIYFITINNEKGQIVKKILVE